MLTTLSTTERTGKGKLLSVCEQQRSHTFCMEMHDRIRTARKAAKLSQRDVARELKVSNSAVAQWELGDTKPTHDNILSFAILTKADVAWLLGITENADTDDAELAALVAHWHRLPTDRRKMVLRMVMTASDNDAPVKGGGNANPPTQPKGRDAA